MHHITGLLKFSSHYLVLAVLLFGVEIIIALFTHDQFIRPYIGDFLVVALIYCFVKSFLNTPVLPTAITVLLFSYAVEITQYFHAINMLGLQDSILAKIILGTSFEWADLVAYTIGIALVLYGEQAISTKRARAIPH